jgi:hypothetical protein
MKIGSGAVCPLAQRGDETGVANVDLVLHLARQTAPVIADFLALEAVAALVTGKGAVVDPPVFQRLAQREAQMVAVGQRGAGQLLLRFHLRQFGIVEAVGLEVGKAPVRRAEIGAQAIGRAIGGERLGDGIDRLEDMAKGQVIARIARMIGHALAIVLQRRVEIADGKVLVGFERGDHHRVRIDPAQVPGLVERLGEFLPLVEHAGIVIARADIVRLDRDGGFEQKFSLVDNLKPLRDLGQQAHALGMGGVGLKELAAQRLGLREPVFLNHARHPEQGRRQGGQIIVLGQRIVGRVALLKLGQPPPRGGQRRIGGHRALIGGQSARPVALRQKAVPALLQGAAMGGIERKKVIERGQRPGQIVLIAAHHRVEIEAVAIVGLAPENLRNPRPRPGQIAALHGALNVPEQAGNIGSLERKLRHRGSISFRLPGA